MDREFYHLKDDVDPEDIGDVLLKIQRSFNIKFDNNDLGKIVTFSDLCDVIRNKITFQHEDSCTTQHAFYMLRQAIATVTGADKRSIVPHSRLAELFPNENRLESIFNLELELGFNINLLQPKQWIVGIFSLTFILSLVLIYFSWQIGLPGCLASVLGLRLAGKFGKEIHLRTVGDLANKISRESYLKARRNNIVNKKEIEQKVRELLTNELELKPVMITRQSRF